MRLLRYIHEEMTRPLPEVEAIRDQSTPEESSEQERFEEKDSNANIEI
jgi:hypothetical protein